MPRGVSDSGFDPVGLIYLALILGVMFAPLLFGRRPSPPDSDSDPDGGHGKGPRRPPGPPSGPRGGVPLPDAEQSRIRLRERGRLADGSPGPWRRYVHRPARRKQRTPL